MSVIKLSHLGLNSFITVRDPIDESFRPTATSFISEDKDVFEDVKDEYIETLDAINSYKNIVTLLYPYTTPWIHRPMDLHPAWWNINKPSSDVAWYNENDTQYVAFKNWNNVRNFFPAKISIILPDNQNLSWISYSGYAHDKNLNVACMKAMYELIERDDFTAWWHKSLNIYQISSFENPLLHKMIKNVEKENLKCNLYQIPNEWGLYTVMCVIASSNFPQVSIGLGTNSILESACIHAIDECVGTYKGHLWEALHGKIAVSDLKSKEILKQIHRTKKNSILCLKETFSMCELMRRTQTYVTCINSKNGYTVKAFSTILQPETLSDTTPFTSRLLLRTKVPLKKGKIPFW